MAKKFNYIYKTTNLISGKIYVGHHSSNIKNNSYLGSSETLKADIKSIGKENFSKYILEFCKYEELSNREKFWIEYLDAINLGYNKHIKGTGQKVGFKHTEETIKKFKLIAKDRDISGKNNPMYGRIGSLNPMYGVHRFGENAPMFGKKRNAESKRNQRETMKGKYNGENNPFYGKTHSEETKAKIRETKRKNFEAFGSKMKGVPKSEKAKESYRKAWEKKEYLKCPYCGIESRSAANMKRYHFDNCKLK